MSDANSGEGLLQGCVTNIPLMCGSVYTPATCWVGDQTPFQLLLGRPWQRGNYVSIDERLDGTYLLFKDHNLPNYVQYEVLVANEDSYEKTKNINKYMRRVNPYPMMGCFWETPEEDTSAWIEEYIEEPEEAFGASPQHVTLPERQYDSTELPPNEESTHANLIGQDDVTSLTPPDQENNQTKPVRMLAEDLSMYDGIAALYPAPKQEPIGWTTDKTTADEDFEYWDFLDKL